MMLGNSRMLALTMLAVLTAWMTPAVAQQPLVVRGGQAAGGGTQWRYASPYSGSLRWLLNPSVQKELELIDQQVEKVKKIQQDIQKELQDIQKEMSGVYRQGSDVPAEERQKRYEEWRQKYYDLNAELADRTEKELQEVLLPEQRERLKQIDLQMRLRSYYSLGQELSNEELAKRLGISERQKEKLLELQQELREEIQRKTREFYARIQEEAEKKMLDALTSAQRRELEGMMGERFEWSYSYGGQSAQGGQKK